MSAGIAEFPPLAVPRFRRFGDYRREDERPLAVDNGCAVQIGGVWIAGSDALELLEWLPLSTADLATIERGSFEQDPLAAVALLIRPPTIWSLDEASGFDSLCTVDESHLRATRRALRLIETQLPVCGFPRANAVVARDCGLVASDDGWCERLARVQLVRYRASAAVIPTVVPRAA